VAGRPRRHAPLTAVAAPLGLYIHIPFCSAICHYCNFNRGLMDAGLKEAYVAALIAHLRRDAEDAPVDTIYFGGGTPSLLEPVEIAAVLDACRASFPVASDVEITMEANPETVDERRLAGFRAAGVNRLSFGVQSFSDAELRRLGRLHDADRARGALREARAAGFDNVSLDLMMWLPQQTRADWQSNVEGLIDVGPEHASLYLLELYPNAPLKEDMARAGWSQAPDDDAAEMYLWSLERLDAAGYAQYEISNVSRPGMASRHNLKYWQDGEWLGFGCGAHSTRRGVRWKNVSSTEDYIAQLIGPRRGLTVGLVAERREMAAGERLEDALFTGIRLTEGLDMTAIHARYGVDVWSQYGTALQPFVTDGLVCVEGPRLRLSRNGMLVANEIMQVFV
jgi:oxygen-independent coproporphyrinogen-3 oxidase